MRRQEWLAANGRGLAGHSLGGSCLGMGREKVVCREGQSKFLWPLLDNERDSAENAGLSHMCNKNTQRVEGLASFPTVSSPPSKVLSLRNTPQAQPPLPT